MNTTPIDVRPQAVAGMFYPGDAPTLRRTVQQLLDEAQAGAREAGAKWPKALIVPHAGYIYSGSTAAKAFAQLAPGKGAIKRVVLLGPVHRVPVRGLALPGTMAFETPLGHVALDIDAMRALGTLPQVTVSPRAHQWEHSLEVQLPFLQQVLGDFKLLPLAVGDATPREVAEVLEKVWGGDETLIVISSDLSHYHRYDEARSIDKDTVEAMLHGDASIDHEHACGATPVNGLLLAAPKHGLKPRLVSLCNSGDTAGDKDRVVGYASLAFDAEGEAAGDELPAEAGATLLRMARAAISTALGRPQSVDAGGDWLNQPGATFVTLKDDGHDLRGCIGTLEPHRSLAEDVKSNALSAAFRDPRFPALSPRELDGITVEVSLLSAPEPMSFTSEEDAIRQLRPDVDGVILEYGGHRGTFLPQVWEQLPDARQFMQHLKLKAGLPAAFWDPKIQLARYTVRKWSEEDTQR